MDYDNKIAVGFWLGFLSGILSSVVFYIFYV